VAHTRDELMSTAALLWQDDTNQQHAAGIFDSLSRAAPHNAQGTPICLDSSASIHLPLDSSSSIHLPLDSSSSIHLPRFIFLEIHVWTHHSMFPLRALEARAITTAVPLAVVLLAIAVGETPGALVAASVAASAATSWASSGGSSIRENSVTGWSGSGSGSVLMGGGSNLFMEILVVDDETGRGVPLVFLELVSHAVYVTDSSAWDSMDSSNE